MPAAAATQQRRALARGFAFAVGHAQDFGGVNVHHAGIHGDDGLGLLMMEAAETESAKAATRAAHAGVLGFAAELRDAAHDDGVHAQQLA